MHEIFDDETVDRFSKVNAKTTIKITGDEILYYAARDHYENKDFIEYIANLSDEKIKDILCVTLKKLIDDTACNTTELIMDEMEEKFMEETYND